MVDGRQQKRQNDRNRGSKKRPAANPDEGIRKRLKASQLEPGPEPNISSAFQGDINPMDIDSMDQLEPSSELESSSTVQVVPPPAISKVVERTMHVMEQCWGGRQDNNSDEDENDGDEDDGGQDDEDMNDADEDNNEDEDEDNNEDEDEDKRPGLSAWDMLGEAFEREAAALGLSWACESFTQLKLELL